MLNEILELFRRLVEQSGSDLILRAGHRPVARIDGRIVPLSENMLSDEHLTALTDHLLDPPARERFANRHEADLAAVFPGIGRFRCNLLQQRGRVASVFRHVQETVPSMDALHLPSDVLKRLSLLRRGMVLVTGIAGSGKSTTLATMIDHMNQQTSRHVVTIEDPIEFVFRDAKAAITQREVNIDTPDFQSALRAAMRQTPDVILVGEMRDAETVSAALSAAETGHLVLSTLHTVNAVQTVERIISFYPPHLRDMVRLQLSLVLEGVVSQRLVRRRNMPGRVPAVEILLGTPSVKEMLLEGRTRELAEALEQGHAYYGSQSFNQSLAQLIRDGLISLEDGLEAADNPDELQLTLRGISKGVSNSDVAFGSMGQPAPAPRGGATPPAPRPGAPAPTPASPRIRQGSSQF